MNLLSLTLFGRQLSPENIHFLFFISLGLLAVLWVVFAWKRGDKLATTIALAAAGLTLFYLTSPYVTDSGRWWVAGAILLVGLVQLWRNRDRVWKPLLLATGMIVSLLAVSLTSNSVNLYFFEKFLGKGIGLYFLGCLAWLVIQVVIPRTRGKQQASQAAGFCVIVSLVMLIVAVTWWRDAVDGNALPDSPVATTGKKVSELSQRPFRDRRHGIFAIGLLDDPESRKAGSPEDSGFITHYIARGPGSGPKGINDSKLPIILSMQMADGALVNFEGISSIHQAFRWPQGGPGNHLRGLRHGDPVVVWGDPDERVTGSDGMRIPSLKTTRVIAYGDLDAFRREFLSDLVKTSRVFGWIAISCMFLSAIPLCFSIRTLFRHRRAAGGSAR